MVNENENPRGAKYRETADNLRGLARRVHFDVGRRGQLFALADEFDRLADYVEGLKPMASADRPE